MTLVEEALRVWREAERLLETLPSTDPNHAEILTAVDEVRVIYREVTERREYLTEQRIAASQRVIERSEALLARVHTKLAEQ